MSVGYISTRGHSVLSISKVKLIPEPWGALSPHPHPQTLSLPLLLFLSHLFVRALCRWCLSDLYGLEVTLKQFLWIAQLRCTVSNGASAPLNRTSLHWAWCFNILVNRAWGEEELDKLNASYTDGFVHVLLPSLNCPFPRPTHYRFFLWETHWPYVSPLLLLLRCYLYYRSFVIFQGRYIQEPK